MRTTTRKKCLARLLTATVAVSALPMIFGAPSASAAPNAPSDTPSQAQWKALDKVATAHSALGVFGLTDTVLMLPAGTSAEKKSQVQAEIPAGMKVAVKISKFTKGEADEVQKSVMSGEWNKTGEKFGLVAAYDGQKDRVHVAVEGPRSAAEALQKRYAGKVEAGPGRGTPQWGRYADSVPFWGGGSIKSPYGGGTCTAGYAVRDNVTGKTKMVTAGHCAPLWAEIQTQDGKYFGNVERRRKDIDADLISNGWGMDYIGFIWTGGTQDSGSHIQVTNWSGWTYLGRKLCVSGQTTYNHCGHPVSANGVAISYNVFGEWNTINSEAAYMMDRGGTDWCSCNGQFTAPGDSGAPVYELTWDQYTFDHQGANIMGHHHGKFFWNGQDRMVNVKPGQVLVDWNLRMMYGSSG
ncbi:hypothetical protein CTU88_14420 [Streptomyces sp. JV178]|uniref:hypothetical protein n=1 Tax=Streptomyces sp. JV178 TaxID=858632 RepID=UPI000C1B38E9|nr:hypothetical protein [Streptomyces sp. JV178]PIM71304.1 hypothetical protein CTU88_14420 [Streptomyces sp. JV178]